MLPLRREHKFQKISVSAIYLNFSIKITSQNELLDAPMASKAPQERSQTLLETLFGCLWVSLGALLGAFGSFWSAQGPPGRAPAPLWELSLKDFA